MSSQAMLNPALIFSIIWIAETLACILAGWLEVPTLHGYNLSSETAFVVAVCVSAFVSGYFMSQLCFGNMLLTTRARPAPRVVTFFLTAQFIITVIGIYALWIEIGTLSTANVEAFSFSLIRMGIVSSQIESGESSVAIRLLFASVGISMLLLTQVARESKKVIFITILLGSMSAIATTGRIAMAMLFVALLYRSISIAKIRWSGIIFQVSIFFIFFILIALAMGKDNSSGSDSQLNQIIWNITIYGIGSLIALDVFITTGGPVSVDFAMIPSAFREIAALPPRAAVNPFILYPIETNTYTAILPPFNDGGVLGCAIFYCILGFGYRALFQLAMFRGGVWEFFYAISLYMLLMTGFEDPYFSSTGIYLIFAAVGLLYVALNKILKHEQPSLSP
jgi:oligosaccharide repeat unit polymerase